MDEPGNTLAEEARTLYALYGQSKAMGESAPDHSLPHYFLLRTMYGENDLLVILNTKRCHYQCYFCQLPAKSSRFFIDTPSILRQFGYVLSEAKHALSILDRVTLSNEGSVLDERTLPPEALDEIVSAVGELRRVRRLVLETRLEYVNPDRLMQFTSRAPRARITVLTGFESADEDIRQKILGKREPLNVFLRGLDSVAAAGADLNAYVLYKPAPGMSDDEAYAEAGQSIHFLVSECDKRKISLAVRLNPMYLAKGSRWAAMAALRDDYQPPRLTDVMRLAEKWAIRGLAVYIGLSTEGLSSPEGTYLSRDDYSPRLIRFIKEFNDRHITEFPQEAWGAL